MAAAAAAARRCDGDARAGPAAPLRRQSAGPDSAALYRTLSQNEKNPDLARIYARLAAVEEAHAAFWRDRLAAIGRTVPGLRPGFRTRALIWLARRFGPAFVLPTVNTLEQLDSGAVLARLEGQHRGLGSNALRAAVLGANDGLVSNLSLVAGVAGAGMTAHAVLISGLAGLLAGWCSMALGEWLSVNTARESAHRQIDTEAHELDAVPEEECLPQDLAQTLAGALIANKKTALDTLVREELGIDPGELGGSAWVAAGTSFLLFALGAVVPVGSYFALAGMPALIASLAASGAALALIGAGTTLFTGRSLWFSATRQLVVGLAAAGVTYGIGELIGAAVTG